MQSYNGDAGRTLRDRLRVDTALKHELVDQVYSSLDLTQRRDLRVFLAAQAQVLGAIRCRPGQHSAAAEELRQRLVAAHDADLHDLGGRPDSSMPTRQLDGTAVLYILLGSSLGAQVLRRRWLEATDPLVATAGHYLQLALPRDAWRELCFELSQRPSQGTLSDEIVCDAETLFDLHLSILSDRSSAGKDTGMAFAN